MGNERFPITWYAYTIEDGANEDRVNVVSYSLLDSTYFDYSVSGNTLTIFLSDSSRTYIKVGN